MKKNLAAEQECCNTLATFFPGLPSLRMVHWPFLHTQCSHRPVQAAWQSDGLLQHKVRRAMCIVNMICRYFLFRCGIIYINDLFPFYLSQILTRSEDM